MISRCISRKTLRARNALALGVSAVCLLPLLGPTVGWAEEVKPTAAIGVEPSAEGGEVRGWLSREVRLFRSYPHLDRAYRLLDEKNLIGAKGELDTLLAINPDNSEAQEMALLVVYKMSDYAAVQSFADHLLSSGRGPDFARMYRGLANRQLRHFDAAAADFEAIVANPKVTADDRVSALSSLAETRIQQKEYGKALAVLDVLAPSAPRFDTFYRKGYALANLGRHEEAYEASLQALGIADEAPQIRNALRQLGRSAASIGKFEEATTAVKKMLRLPADDPRQMRFSAELAYGAGRPADALQLLQPTLAGNASIEDRQLASSLAYEVGANDVAIEQSQRVVDQSTDPATRKQALLTIAYAAGRLGKSALATKTFLQAYEIDHDPNTAVAAAQALENAGRNQDAVELLEPIVLASPTADTLAQLGVLFAKLGRQDDAARQLNRALNRLPPIGAERQRIAMTIGYGFTQLGMLNDAADAFHRAQDGWIDSAAAVAEARTLDAAGRAHEAVAVLEHTVADEADLEARIALSSLLLKVGEDQKAVTQLRAILFQMPEEDARRYDFLMELGYAELRNGRVDRSVGAFRDAVKLRHEPEALLALSEALDRAKDVQGAIAAATQAASIVQDSAAFLRLGLLYSKVNDDRHAVAQLQRALAGRRLPEAERSLAYRQIGYSNSRLGRYAEAEQAFKQALQFSPRDPELYAALADARLTQGNAAGALQASEQSLSLLTTTAALRSRAAANVKLGDDRAAVQSYHDLLEQSDLSNTERAEVLTNLAFASRRLGEQSSATDAFRQALAIGVGSEANLRLNLADTLAGTGDWKNAIVQYRLAYAAEPRSEILLSIAHAQVSLGENKAAIELLDGALRANQLAANERKSALDELGYIYAKQRDYPEAAVAWRRSLDTAYDPVIALRLARAQRINGAFNVARKTLDNIQSFTLSPTLQAERFDETALLEVQANNLTAATEAEESALELDPKPERSYQLALLYKSQANLPKAITCLEDAVRQSSDPRFAEELAYTLMAAGRDQDAMRVFRGVAEADVNNQQSRKELGYLALRNGDTRDASKWFEEAIDRMQANSEGAKAIIVRKNQ